MFNNSISMKPKSSKQQNMMLLWSRVPTPMFLNDNPSESFCYYLTQMCCDFIVMVIFQSPHLISLSLSLSIESLGIGNGSLSA